MKTRHLPGLAKPRIRASGAEAAAVRAFLAERLPDARVVGEDEAADFVMMKPDDFEEALEDVAAAAAYARTRREEFVPVSVADRLLAGESPLKVWREYRGMSLSALAVAASVGKGYLSQIENGERRGTVNTLKKLAAALVIDLDDLTRS